MKIGDVHGPSYSRCRRLRPISGSGGRTRTATGFTPTGFESVVSTNFTTPPSESGRIILTLIPKATDHLYQDASRPGAFQFYIKSRVSCRGPVGVLCTTV